MMAVPIAQRLTDFAAEFDRYFGERLTADGDAPPELAEAVRYSALAPGKRIRPYLVTRCCEIVGGTAAEALPVASAVECIHAFSLIHDDLPALDDDDLRRGRPACHKRFNEATAILAGDALVVLAFELLGCAVEDRVLAADMVVRLARATGWTGMIGGQMADVAGESQPASVEAAHYIHERKTACLFQAACELGAMAGHADGSAVAALGRFGHHVGRAFQIADDLLDLTATPEAFGKEVRKDALANKQTLPRCVGTERSRALAREAADAARWALVGFGPEADDLRALADYVVDRNY